MIDYKKIKEKMNPIEIDNLKEIKTYLNSCSYINLLIRHNGADIIIEADFLKHILKQIDCDFLI